MTIGLTRVLARLNTVLTRFPREVRVGLGLVVLTAVTFARVPECSFVDFDDGPYIYDNPHVYGGLTWANFCWAWDTYHMGYWQPLTWLSLQLDGSLYGKAAGGYHVTNLFIHAADVMLVFVLLNRMTARIGLSAWVAAFWAVHPLHVESVVWVTERKDVLSTFFGLLAMVAYAWYAHRPNWLRFLPVTLAMALSLMAKPMLVTLPFLLVLLDFWPLSRIRALGGWGCAGSPAPETGSAGPPACPPQTISFLILEKVPLLLLSVCFAAVTVVAQEVVGAMATLDDLPLSMRLSNAMLSYAKYLGMTLWPSGLTGFYPHPLHAQPLWQGALAGLLVLAVTIGALFFCRTKPWLLVGWLWFFGTLFPVSGISQAGQQALADRFTYFPHIGLFVMLVWGSNDLVSWVRWPVVVRSALAAIALAACVGCTWVQVGYWMTNVTFWQRVVQVSPDSSFAVFTLGKGLYQENRTDEAMDLFGRAIEMAPNNRTYRFVYALSLRESGYLEEADAQEKVARKLAGVDP